MADRELTALGQHVREREDQLLSTQVPSEETRRHLAQYVAQRRGPPVAKRRLPVEWRRRASVGLALAGAAALVVLVLSGSGLFASPSLTFSVGESGRAGVLRAWESAPRDGPLPIRFSDGTQVNLDPNARARVVAIGSQGAEIVIESGRAEIDVVPVRGARGVQRPWRVSTGPFSVEVKGTRFDVSWHPNADDFALNLYEGSVVIKGCDGGSGHTIAAGQGVRASCARREWSIVPLIEHGGPSAASERRGASSPDVLPLAPLADAGVGATGGSPAAASGRSSASGGSRAARAERAARSWQALGRAGHYERAYERALSSGFAAACERSSAEELMLLGDVARLNDDVERSRRAYSTLRRRFPSDEAAARAAFALGRLEVERAPRAAARWFDIYLREQPDGALAQAALERLLELTATLDDREWQREVATTYVRRYPEGPHARDARALLERSAPRP
jgi:transmembrane sensor